MSIASEISRITNIRTAILSAIQGRGVEVSDSAVLNDCPWYIENIPRADDARVGIATARNNSNATRLQFTGLLGSPKRFSVVAMAAVNSVVSGSLIFRTYTPCVTALLYNGISLTGHYTMSSYGGSNQMSTTVFSKSFSNGTLTLNTTNPTFPSGITYTIFYEY